VPVPATQRQLRPLKSHAFGSLEGFAPSPPTRRKGLQRLALDLPVVLDALQLGRVLCLRQLGGVPEGLDARLRTGSGAGGNSGRGRRCSSS
jgi:hypothetical protein